MGNPFKYSHVVTNHSFCNRTNEQESLLQFIQGSQNVLIYSHRRTGKSSLIKQVLQNINDQKLGIGMLYVDLYGTTSENDFVSRAFQQMGSLESNTNKLINLLKKSLKYIPFKIGIDPISLTPTLSPEFKTEDKELPLKSLMDLLEKFSTDKKIVVVFDEFQEITHYTDSSFFEKRLRSFVQQHRNICYIFSGSQKHMLSAMFHSQSRAFYQQAASFPLKKIGTDHYVSWLTGLFSASKYPVDPEKLPGIIQRFDNHPMYIQFFCYFLWEELQRNPWEDDFPEKIESLMIENKKPEYQILWDTLTGNQRKTLKLVFIKDGKNLFTGDALNSVEIKTASIVTQCLKYLCENEILAKNGKYVIQDLLLKKWLYVIGN